METILYVRDNEPIPPTYYVIDHDVIQPIDPRDVRHIAVEDLIDVTTIESSHREFIPSGQLIITLANGESISCPSSVLPLALTGGGSFNIAVPNDVYDRPLTEAEDTLEAIEEAIRECDEQCEWY